jgi:hypothetical protein
MKNERTLKSAKILYEITYFDCRWGYRKCYMNCGFNSEEEAIQEFERIAIDFQKRKNRTPHPKGDRILDRKEYALERLAKGANGKMKRNFVRWLDLTNE